MYITGLYHIDDQKLCSIGLLYSIPQYIDAYCNVNGEGGVRRISTANSGETRRGETKYVIERARERERDRERNGRVTKSTTGTVLMYSIVSYSVQRKKKSKEIFLLLYLVSRGFHSRKL